MMSSFVQWKLSVFFIVATLITEVLFKQFLIRTAVLRVEHTVADREVKWILQFQTIAGAHGTICTFHSGYFDTDVLFQQFLIGAAV